MNVYAISGGASGIVIIIIIVVCSVTLTPRTAQFRDSFISKCEKFSEELVERYDCPKVWAAFQKAYVGEDKCNISVKAYQPLIAAAPFKHDSSKTLLWSKTKGLVNAFKEENGLVTLADTLFGNVTKGYKTWCGKKGSNETFTYYCPGKSGCKNNSVRSYWNKASAAFAEYAQGEVTALLSGSSKIPFEPEGAFLNFEVPALQPGKIQSLNVVLVTTNEFVSKCASLGELKRQLDKNKIKCWCKEMLKSQMSDYSSIPKKPCGS